MTNFPGFKPISANFTPTPNQFFDRILGHYHPCVVTVVGLLIRSTLGWEDPDTGARLVEAELPLSAFVRPELSESSARKGIAGAIEAGLMVQTFPATNKQPARYALRWDDTQQQSRAIEKQRKAHGLVRSRGVAVTPHRWQRTGAEVTKPRGLAVTPQTARPVTARPVTVAPPLNKVILKKSSPEKKEDEEKKAPGAPDLLPSVSKEQKEPDQKAIVIPPLFPGQTEAEREAFGAAYRRARKELAKPAFMAKHKRQSGPMDWYQRAGEIQAEEAATAEAAAKEDKNAKGL